jgi:hypothetical protein
MFWYFVTYNITKSITPGCTVTNLYIRSFPLSTADTRLPTQGTRQAESKSPHVFCWIKDVIKSPSLLSRIS